MSPESQRIAIAETCGWTFPLNEGPKLDGVFSLNVPNYCADLNAMSEAVDSLSEDQQWEWQEKLLDVVNVNSPAKTFPVCNARAAQRAEAFLRILGKWDDSK